MNPSRPFEILLVEDSPGDIWLTRQILLQGSTPKNITVVNDGEQALDYLFRRGIYANSRQPDLILLDLNLPKRNGLEVLEKIKSDPALRSITVVVLTTSEAPGDVNSAYELNANCYIVKPVSLDAFTVAIRGIEEFWMGMATLPTKMPPSAEEQKGSESADKDSIPEKNGASGPLALPRFAPLKRYSKRHAQVQMAGCRRISHRASTARRRYTSNS